MRKRIVIILTFIILVFVCATKHFFIRYKDEILFNEEFKNCLNWDRQCTKVDINSNLIMPSAGNQFRTAKIKAEDGMLYLYTGEAEHTGGVEWSRMVDIKINKNSLIEWKWAVHDSGDYQFWIRIGFNNHRSIYYNASGGKTPGLYRGERYVPYRGEKYRDREGRLRFFPSITLLIGIPGNKWTIPKRSIANDYKQSYGDLPDNFRITEITIGMMDDSRIKVNEMGIEYIKIFDFL